MFSCTLELCKDEGSPLSFDASQENRHLSLNYDSRK